MEEIVALVLIPAAWTFGEALVSEIVTFSASALAEGEAATDLRLKRFLTLSMISRMKIE